MAGEDNPTVSGVRVTNAKESLTCICQEISIILFKIYIATLNLLHIKKKKVTPNPDLIFWKALQKYFACYHNHIQKKNKPGVVCLKMNCNKNRKISFLMGHPQIKRVVFSKAKKWFNILFSLIKEEQSNNYKSW